jgi:hypothetical protein
LRLSDTSGDYGPRLPKRLARLIEGFRNLNPEFEAVSSEDGEYTWYHLEDIKDPNKAWGSCDSVSKEFMKYLLDANVFGGSIAFYSSANNALFDSGRLNYNSHIDEETQHSFVLIDLFGCSYIVDWSAAQFGYKEFPLVWTQDKNEWKVII